MNYSLKLSNLLKSISMNAQQNAQKKTKKDDQKQETLFDIKPSQTSQNSDDLYGDAISLSKPPADTNEQTVKTTNLKSLLNNLKNNIVKNNGTAKSKVDSLTVANTDKAEEIVKDAEKNDNIAGTSSSAKLKSLLSSISAKSSAAVSSAPKLSQPVKVEETPKIEKSVEEIKAENLEKTIKSIDKYIARIDLNLLDETNPLSPFGVKHYDFTDYTSEYDEQNRVTKLTPKYNTGVTVDISYDENNNTTVNVNNGRTFTINTKGQLTSYNPYEPYKYTYEYDTDGKLIKTTHNKGHGYIDTYSRYTYDEHGNIVGYGTEGKFINTYDNEGHLLSVSYRNNTLEYDINGNITKDITYNNIITYEYDESNNFVKATDEKGNEYDKNGHIVKCTAIGNGVNLIREAKIAENGQKIINNKWTNAEGITVEFVTDANGFDMNQTVTLTDGTTIETIFDTSEKAQKFFLLPPLKMPDISNKDLGMFGLLVRSGVSITSHTVKNPDGSTAYTLQNPNGLQIAVILCCDPDTNTAPIRNLSFKDGEQIVVNEGKSLTVTKTDGTKEYYDYNKKTKNFELRATTSPADLTYDHNGDGNVDYNDFFELFKINDGYEREPLLLPTAEEIVKNIPENIDMNYLSEFYYALDNMYSAGYYKKLLYEPDDPNYIYPIVYSKIYNKILSTIYNNKEENFDFNKDGKLDAEDVKIFANAFNGEGTSTSYENMPGIDLNGDGTVSDFEKRTLWGENGDWYYDFRVEALIKNAFLKILRQDEENLPNIKAELEKELEKFEDTQENNAKDLLADFISKLDDLSYYDDDWILENYFGWENGLPDET